jgi:cytochrome c
MSSCHFGTNNTNDLSNYDAQTSRPDIYDPFFYDVTEHIEYKDVTINQTEKEFMRDVDRGSRIFYGRCAACHTVSRHKHHQKGPSLFGVIQRKAGSLTNFKYTDALKNSNITWNFRTLDKYLTQPQEFIPGNKMYFLAALPVKEQRWHLYQFFRYNSPTNKTFLRDDKKIGNNIKNNIDMNGANSGNTVSVGNGRK